MARDITVTFADGSQTVYQGAPDNITPEQVTSRAQQEFGKPVKELDGGREPSTLSRVGDQVKNVGSALMKGLVGPITGAMESNPIGRALSMPAKVATATMLGDKAPPLNGTQVVHQTADALYTPKTPGEKYLNSGVEGAASSVYGPGGLAKFVIGGISGLSSEGAAQAFGNNPLVRFLGGLAGGLTASGIHAARANNTPTLAKEALRDVDPTDLQRALAEMEASHNAGVTTNISQHMRDPSNLDAYVSTLANNKMGTEVTQQLRNQPRQVLFNSELQKQELPGAVRPERVIANNAQEAADDAIRLKMKDATKAWEQFAPVDAKVPPTAMQRFDAMLGDLAKKYPNTAQADLINDVRDAIKLSKGGQVTAPVGGGLVSSKMAATTTTPTTYIEDALQAKNAIDDALQNFGPRKLNTPGLQGKELRRAQEVRELWKQVIDNNAPDLSKANTAYSAVMEGSVNPAKKGVLGYLAQPSGSVADRQAATGRIFSLFDKGTLPDSTTSEIRTVGKEFRRAGQAEAFNDAAKTWFAKGIDKALESTDGRVPENTAQRLTNYFGSLSSDNAKVSGMRDILSTVAENQGLNQKDTAAYVRGFENWMKQINAAAKRPGSAMGTNPTEILDTAGSTATRHLGNVSVITPLRQPALWWSRLVRDNSLKEMDKLLTSPEGVRTLVKMGSQPVMSNQSKDLMATFIASGAVTQNSPGITPE